VSGYIRVWRRVFKNPVFFDGERIRMDRLGCWVDLLCTVAWKGHRATLMDAEADLEPGQMLCTYRGLGRRWGMDKNTATRIVGELRDAGMVLTDIIVQSARTGLRTTPTHRVTHHLTHRVTHHPVIRLTVVNWLRWQVDADHDAPASAPGHAPASAPGQKSAGAPLSEEEEKKKTQHSPSPPTRARAREDAAEPETAGTATSTPELTDAELTKPAARIWEAFRREAGLARPPSAREMDRLRGTVRALGGKHEGLLFDVVEIAREAKAAGKKLGSIAYCLAAWEGRQRDKQAEAARLAGLGVKTSSPAMAVAVDPPAELTEEQRAGAVSACRDVLARLGD
jgi:hypothetical protein